MSGSSAGETSLLIDPTSKRQAGDAGRIGASMPLTALTSLPAPGTSQLRSCADAQLRCSTSESLGRSTLYLSGELDMNGYFELNERAATALQSGPAELVLDLSHLEFVDVSGLNALLGVSRVGEQHGCHVVMRGASRRVRRLFDLAGVGALLP